MKTIYVVLKNSNMTDGMGTMIPQCAFTTAELANQYASTQPGIMGYPGQGWEVREMILRDEQYFVDLEEKERLKQRALSKLTTEEKNLLGIKD